MYGMPDMLDMLDSLIKPNTQQHRLTSTSYSLHDLQEKAEMNISNDGKKDYLVYAYTSRGERAYLGKVRMTDKELAKEMAHIDKVFFGRIPVGRIKLEGNKIIRVSAFAGWEFELI